MNYLFVVCLKMAAIIQVCMYVAYLCKMALTV